MGVVSLVYCLHCVVEKKNSDEQNHKLNKQHEEENKWSEVAYRPAGADEVNITAVKTTQQQPDAAVKQSCENFQ